MFLLQSVEGTSRVELNKEKASVAFFDAAGRVRLVYSAPTAKLSNNQTITLGIDWDASASAIVITLPEQSSPPLVLALALGLKYTELKGDSKQRLAGRTLTPTPSDSDKGKEETASKVNSYILLPVILNKLMLASRARLTNAKHPSLE